MKILSTVALAIALVTIPGFCTAQQRAEEMRQVDKATPTLMTGKVTQVDAKAKSFTIMAQGKSVTFSAAELPALPANGDMVDVTYIVTPAGSFKASNLNLAKSNVN
jgi:hypothetical protein